MKRSLIIFGEPGERWTNDGQTVRYQFHCNFERTCGVCLSYHLAIGPIWPIPIHRGCRCWMSIVPPGATAEPFADIMAIAHEMDPSQHQALVGSSNWLLIQKGMVEWSDVVTRSRVRKFREVVARAKFTSEALIEAGVRRSAVDAAMATIHTPAHELADAHRRALVDAIEHAGATRKVIVATAGAKLAERIVIARPKPAAPAKVEPITPEDLPAVAEVVKAFRESLPLPAAASGVVALGRALSSAFAVAEIRRRWDELKAKADRKETR